jgi:hypothetical protein
MKRTLQESLIDYEPAMLEALAEVRGAVLESNHQLTAARELATQLITPASVAFALDELTPKEQEALTALISAGGWLETPRFSRRFGDVRQVGHSRLLREKPWQEPTNPAEGLWYRALIFKGFRQTDTGLVEVVYIPADLLSLLPGPPQAPQSPHEDVPNPTAPPPQVTPSTTDLIEDTFVLLAHIRGSRVRVAASGNLKEGDQQAVTAQMTPPRGPEPVERTNRLAFIFFLCRATGLVAEARGEVALSREHTQAWLLAPPTQALAGFFRLWQRDTEWNDLQHVPGLQLQPTGWHNDPLAARSTILNLLRDLQANQWYRLNEILAWLKQHNPDFQRPDGDYSTWYILDEEGVALMGFEHWDAVEGALITFLLTAPLHWLGIVDLGFTDKDGARPSAIRLTQYGKRLINEKETVELQGTAGDAAAILAVDAPSTIRFNRRASLFDRFQLARFAEFAGWEEDAVRYTITPESLAHVRRQGVGADQITAFLLRVGSDRIPTALLQAMDHWRIPGMAVELQEAVLLRTESAAALDSLLQDGSLRPLLQERLGPTTALITQGHVQSLRRWLVQHGYLDQA